MLNELQTRTCDNENEGRLGDKCSRAAWPYYWSSATSLFFFFRMLQNPPYQVLAVFLSSYCVWRKKVSYLKHYNSRLVFSPGEKSRRTFPVCLQEPALFKTFWVSHITYWVPQIWTKCSFNLFIARETMWVSWLLFCTAEINQHLSDCSTWYIRPQSGFGFLCKAVSISKFKPCPVESKQRHLWGHNHAAILQHSREAGWRPRCLDLFLPILAQRSTAHVESKT